ncbi:methyltransferase domain-containing protein [Kribbella antibiotica]|uniref:Methyltransferase domain-containing protein n=1 Tax=Kribbella antibiotica TaxID=190195 RepID=A0A4R4YRZ9_9ACTN|nr:methyltransferase domain-containing protein [Kribbella antibiotica]TDD46342.1 methyltransferase domain-containing protein [Kribbella antibiotica]
MDGHGSDAVFVGSIPEFYDEYMVPMIFAAYAEDLARRVVALDPGRVLEVAAGTGVVTRAVMRMVPGTAELVATDLNQAMLDQAEATGTARPVRWQQADAMQLPFEDATFDVVFCQFGVMFFPDKVRAFAEARRVLRPGGTLLFNVWDSLADNEFAGLLESVLAGLYPADPPRFMGRTPHGYFDLATIANDLTAAGFTTSPHHETIAARSHARSAQAAAIAYCQGTPLRAEIEARATPDLAAATAACAEALAQRYGPGPIEGKIQAHIITVKEA